MSAKRRDVMFPHTRRVPNLSAIETAYARLRTYPNVTGFYVGQKVKRRRRTRQLALVVCVSTKVPKRALKRDEHIPPWLSIPLGRGVSMRLWIDVQQVGESARYVAASAGPGDGFMPGEHTEPQGTMGVALDHPTLGRVVTTAAHVVISRPDIQLFDAGTGPRCRVLNVRGNNARFDGRVRKVMWTDDTDVAFIETDSSITNLFEDDLLVATPQTSAPSDEGTALLVLTQRGVGATTFRGVHASIDVGGFPVRDALLTDHDTEPGDSGCCLVDSEFRVWGLLAGFTTLGDRRFSVFQSLDPLTSISGEGARLV